MWESERRKLGIDDVLDVAKQSNFQFGSKKNSEMFGWWWMHYDSMIYLQTWKHSGQGYYFPSGVSQIIYPSSFQLTDTLLWEMAHE